MSVSKEYMQQKYGHLGELVVVKKNGKNRTCIKMSCENCKVDFYRHVSAYKRNRNFCSVECGGNYYKTNATPIEDYILDSDGIMKPRIKCKSFSQWNDMIRRTTDSRFKEIKPTYKDCNISENFKDFNYFHNWCLQQIGYNKNGYELDKDILIKGNKEYSENHCCFVPKEINMQFVKSDTIRGDYPIGVTKVKSTGKYITQVKRKRLGRYSSLSNSVEEAFIKYKKVKEDYIKYLADIYKDNLDEKVYNALYAYEVEITD